MDQVFKKRPATQDEKQNLKDALSKVEKVETPATRVVQLSYKSCCGCGCDYKDVTRVVPYDSPLKNGDRITSLERGDKY